MQKLSKIYSHQSRTIKTALILFSIKYDIRFLNENSLSKNHVERLYKENRRLINEQNVDYLD